ncbi:MAG: aldo/keto reductase [Kofleriaceae bacterium]|nr:aldo/keto reductase [Kofleriaceae bacterium]
MISQFREHRTGRIPSFLYGTAWKEEATATLVTQALAAGFRGIDTANQRKHYHEAGVGEALKIAFERGTVRRDELYLQTKFTFRDGQDHRLPYDAAAPVATQVAQSLASSLQHLGVTYIDSLLLHGPSQSGTLGAADYEAWRAMELLVDDGQVGVLGISNVAPQQVHDLVAFARIAPTFVQNRCYASRGWDHEVRAVCADADVIYQGFSLLTANKSTLAAPVVLACAAHHARTPAQIVFRYALQLNMLPLTGSSSAAHLREDLQVFDFALSVDEMTALTALAVG